MAMQRRTGWIAMTGAVVFGTTLSLVAVRAVVHAQSRGVDAGGLDASMRDANATDAAAIDAGSDGASTPRPGTRPPRGAFRPLDDESPLVGCVFVPSVDDPARGQLSMIWTRRAHADLHAHSEYRIEGETLVLRDASGHESSIRFVWSRGSYLVHLGERDEELIRTPSVCSVARDCDAQADQQPALTCSQRVQWSCGRDDHRCRAHCGSPSHTPAHQRCGNVWCPAGQVCCNTAASVCARPGEGCGQ